MNQKVLLFNKTTTKKRRKEETKKRNNGKNIVFLMYNIYICITTKNMDLEIQIL